MNAMKDVGVSGEERRRAWIISEREKTFQQTVGQANARRAFEKEVRLLS
jgi:hypothetical protein